MRGYHTSSSKGEGCGLQRHLIVKLQIVQGSSDAMNILPTPLCVPKKGWGRARTSAAVRTALDLPRALLSKSRRSSSASGAAARPARSSRASASMCAGAKLPSSLHSALRRCRSGVLAFPLLLAHAATAQEGRSCD